MIFKEVWRVAQKIMQFDRRQYMLRPDFEITHKRDTYLANVELHHHDFFEIFFLVSGDVTYTVESRVYHMLPGDLLLINPRELHQVRIQQNMAPYERFVLWISPSTLSELSGPNMNLAGCFDSARPGYGNLHRLQPEDRSFILKLMQSMYDETDSGRFGSDTLQAILLQAILIYVNRLILQGGAQSEQLTHSCVAVSEAVTYINLHYGEELSLDDLAARFFVSKYHLSHEFNRQVGTSVYRYILKKRLLIARQRLSQGEKPNQVYNSCGFRDYAGFYRAFKSEYGISPRQFAASCQQQRQLSPEPAEAPPGRVGPAHTDKSCSTL